MKLRHHDKPHSKHRVLLVDDNTTLREIIARWLDRTPDLKVCGQAESAAAALRLVETTRLDIVVTDLGMPDGDGMGLIKALHAMRPELPVLVLSMHQASIFEERALEAGAAGYVMKGEGAEKLLTVIRELVLHVAP